jgi:hypothetical protein
MQSRPAIIIVAPRGDKTAGMVAGAIRLRAPDALTLWISPTKIALAHWTQTVSNGEGVRTMMELPGIVLDDSSIGAVWFCVDALPVPRFQQAKAIDRDYAAAELHALAVSWIRSLGKKAVNGTDGQSIAGPSWSQRRWLCEARAAGLPISENIAATSPQVLQRWRSAKQRPELSDRMDVPVMSRILTAGGRVLGRFGRFFEQQCLRLSLSSGCQLLEILVRGEDERNAAVTAVSAMPTLTDAEEISAAAAFLLDVSGACCQDAPLHQARAV